MITLWSPPDWSFLVFGVVFIVFGLIDQFCLKKSTGMGRLMVMLGAINIGWWWGGMLWP